MTVLKKVQESKGCCFSGNCCILGVALAVVIFACVIRDGLMKMQKDFDIVSAHGTVEKIVQADFAVWAIPITAVGDELEIVRAKIATDVAKITAYLKQYEISEAEVEQDTMRVFDRMAQKYYDENNKAKRFIIDHQLIIRSKNVRAVQKASKNINDLLEQNVNLAYDGYTSGAYLPCYMFTKLNEIKPEMLSSVMQEAKKAAESLMQSNSAQKITYHVKNISYDDFNVHPAEHAMSTLADPKVMMNCGNASGNYANGEIYFVDKIVSVTAKVDYYIE